MLLKEKVDTMLRSVSEWLNDNVPGYKYGHPLPEGLMLQMHPSTLNAIYQSIEFSFEEYRAGPAAALAKRCPVPVKISPELDLYAFRLVTVTEEVHFGGKID